MENVKIITNFAMEILPKNVIISVIGITSTTQ